MMSSASEIIKCKVGIVGWNYLTEFPVYIQIVVFKVVQPTITSKYQ